MEYLTNLLLWTERCAFLLTQICVAVTAAFVLFHSPKLRRAIARSDEGLLRGFPVIVLFSIPAIISTHAGEVLDLRQAVIVARPIILGQEHFNIDIREVFVIVAGLSCGIWVGFGVGFTAGLHRLFLGSSVAEPVFLASIGLGILAGLTRRYWPKVAWNPWRAAAVGVAAALIQRLIIFWQADLFGHAWDLVRYLLVSKVATNALGCGLFVKIMRMIDNDQLELTARHAEIRALQAQVDPHFLMNTLNAIKALIVSDPDRARSYVVKLGQFFLSTRRFAQLNAIPLRQEREHLFQYLDFQQLRFNRAVLLTENIEPAALEAFFPPRTLQTLVENSLQHGFDRTSQTLELSLNARIVDQNLQVELADNGRGIPEARLSRLGHNPVPSGHEGGGFSLYQLRQSLVLAFGRTARLDILSREGSGTRVRLSLPFRTKAW